MGVIIFFETLYFVSSLNLVTSDLPRLFTVPWVLASLLSSLLWTFDILFEDVMSDRHKELSCLFLLELTDSVAPRDSFWEGVINLSSAILLLEIFDWFSCWSRIHGETVVLSVDCSVLIVLDSVSFSRKVMDLAGNIPFDCNCLFSALLVRS